MTSAVFTAAAIFAATHDCHLCGSGLACAEGIECRPSCISDADCVAQAGAASVCITEGVNGKAKLVKRRAYGYKTFANHRLRLLKACA